LALVERSTVARRLGLAISNLVVDEWRLLAMDARVSERAVAFSLGWHLRQVMERSWDIDCEYNRVFHGAEAIVKRPQPPAADDPNRQTVTPDLIVHRRGERKQGNNLLVLELKTNHQRQGSRGGSLESVQQVVTAHGYKHGVLLDLRMTSQDLSPVWTWVDDEGQPLEPESVFQSDVARRALMDRGREEERRRYGVA
jgi:hypothetical protein